MSAELKPVARSLLLLILSVTVLGALTLLGLVRLGELSSALHEHPREILLTAGAVLASLGIGSIRLLVLMRAARIEARLLDVVAASYFSAGVSLWFPGSMTVNDVVRYGLVLGAAHPGSSRDSGPEVGARLAVASFVDRVIGTSSIFVVGGATAFGVLWASPDEVRLPAGLALVAMVALLAGVALVALVSPASPGFAPSALARLAGSSEAKGRHGWLSRMRRKLEYILSALREAWHQRAASWSVLSTTLGLSIAGYALVALSMYYPAQALGVNLSYPVILAALPLTIIGTLIPVGLAGFGGHQLIAAGAFGLFVVPPSGIVSASLLNSAVVLVCCTLVAALFSLAAKDQARALLGAIRQRSGGR